MLRIYIFSRYLEAQELRAEIPPKSPKSPNAYPDAETLNTLDVRAQLWGV